MSRRAERLSAQIERELGPILHQRVKDPHIGFITVTRVLVSHDLSFARVYYTVFGDANDIGKTREALGRAVGFIRHALGLKLSVRRTPELRFEFDAQYLRGMEVIDTIHELTSEPLRIDETDLEGS